MTFDHNQLTQEIIGAAIEVHRRLGPGLLESAYQACLCHEFTLCNIAYKKEVSLPIVYKGCKLETGYRVDILVMDQIVLELKAIEKLAAIHEVQLVTYLKLGQWPLGLLINFNVPLLKDGIRRRVNNLVE